MITTNAQWGAVRPTGLRKRKPRHLDALRSQHGVATQQVVATKQKQQRDEETAFDQEQSRKSLALQQQQTRDAKKSAKKQETLGGINTGLNLLNTILDFW